MTLPARELDTTAKSNLRGITLPYYMASSVSGQDEPNPALELAIRAGKMALSCPLGITRCPARKISRSRSRSHIINPLLTKREVKMAGYWPRSFFFACLWTSTQSWSINTLKKNLANIQPSWLHAWSITHISSLAVVHNDKDGLWLSIRDSVFLHVDLPSDICPTDKNVMFLSLRFASILRILSSSNNPFVLLLLCNFQLISV